MYGRSHHWVLEQLFPDKHGLKEQELLVTKVTNTEKRTKKQKWKKARTPPFSCSPLSTAQTAIAMEPSLANSREKREPFRSRQLCPGIYSQNSL